jgi:hypothetical protein
MCRSIFFTDDSTVDSSRMTRTPFTDYGVGRLCSCARVHVGADSVEVARAREAVQSDNRNAEASGEKPEGSLSCRKISGITTHLMIHGTALLKQQ